jgi:hypothetical protein
MLDYGKRGCLINDNLQDAVIKIEEYLNNEKMYSESVGKAKNWSQQYTLDTFESAIKELI